MDITELRQKARKLKADTVHVRYGSDGVTVEKAALFVEQKKVFAFPANYSPKIFPEDVNEYKWFKVAKRGEYDNDSWRTHNTLV